MTPRDFWAPWEEEAKSFDDILKTIHDEFDDWSKSGRVFAWRGQVDADWALHSVLYRRIQWTDGSPPKEERVRSVEKEILKRAHQWSLHMSNHGRLSILNQLAILQHYGSPTRLIDITFNPLIGLWFAVEEQWRNGSQVNEDKDGRLFAFDVTDRLINEDDSRRDWADKLEAPWKEVPKREWTTSTFAWHPPRLDHRIAAQNGGFLFGGVPNSTNTNGKSFQWPRTSAPKDGKWRIEDVRSSVSVPIRFHKINKGGPGISSANPAYTFRIKAAAKREIRNRLQQLYGYTHSTIYPDHPGFSTNGYPSLKTQP